MLSKRWKSYFKFVESKLKEFDNSPDVEKRIWYIGTHNPFEKESTHREFILLDKRYHNLLIKWDKERMESLRANDEERAKKYEKRYKNLFKFIYSNKPELSEEDIIVKRKIGIYLSVGEKTMKKLLGKEYEYAFN